MMHRLVEQLQSDWPLAVWRTTRVLVAVSGGADSVALLLALHQLSSDSPLLHVGHYNHRWRGDESDQDARFVAELSNSLDIESTIGVASQDAVARSEAAARTARYEFLQQTAYAKGCRYVVTAHTSSDRCETALHNLFRGTGLSGMAGPQRRRSFDEQLVLVRPILSCSRNDVVDYLASRGQAYRSDSSNQDQSYRRNFLRHRVLPTLREQYGQGVDQSIVNFSEIAEETLELLDALADEYLQQAASLTAAMQSKSTPTEQSATGSGFKLPSISTLPVRWPILQTAIRRLWIEQSWPMQSMTRQHWTTVRELFGERILAQQANSTKRVIQLPGAVSVTATETHVRFERKD
ncbi:MAG: tRNA lysidine(34) synthetase TilS [Aureliella sp.]